MTVRRRPSTRGSIRVPWWLEVHWRLLPESASEPTLRVNRGFTTVGRDADSGLQLDDPSVSRIHARLDLEDFSLFVTDLKSGNGTRVNGELVGHHELSPGDTLAFGDLTFALEQRRSPAWPRLLLVAGVPIALGLLALGIVRITERMEARRQWVEEQAHSRELAVASTHDGIEAIRSGETEAGRARLLYAADLFLLAGLAGKGNTLARPASVFASVTTLLRPADRSFDFSGVLSAASVDSTNMALASLTNDEYIDSRLRVYAEELGQAASDVPAGFLAQVRQYVEEYTLHPSLMRTMLARSRDLQPRMRAILATRHLPESFCYVAWVESNLNRVSESGKRAVGLWQLMPEVAREHHLRVDPEHLQFDERTDIDLSTNVAADYFARLLRDQGPEYLMLVLASYNRGPGAVDRAKQKIIDPMLKASEKYWYLIEHELLPEETRKYVPRIFAVRLIAEDPTRFQFEKP